MWLRSVFLLIMRLATWLRLTRREETWKTAEILILRHQLTFLQRHPRRPKLNWADRALLATLAQSIFLKPSARNRTMLCLSPIPAGSPSAGQALGDITWPPGCVPVTVVDNGNLRDPDPGIIFAPGDHINLLAPEARNPEPSCPRGEPGSQPGEHPADARPPGQALRPEDGDQRLRPPQ
jgi:hypothetical protein